MICEIPDFMPCAHAQIFHMRNTLRKLMIRAQGLVQGLKHEARGWHAARNAFWEFSNN